MELPQSKPKGAIFSSSEALHIALDVQQHLDDYCQITVWSQEVFGVGEEYIKSLRKCIKHVDFSVIIWSGDDNIVSKGQNYTLPRDNVIFECGLSICELGIKRTFLLYNKDKNVKIPSDLAGVHQIGYNLHSNEKLFGSLGAPCHQIQKKITTLGCLKREIDNLRDQVILLQENNNKLILQKELAKKTVIGKRLFQHKGCYPIKLDVNNFPSIDKTIYLHAMAYFLQEKNYDRLAVMDLLYLRENNLSHDGDFLTSEELNDYDQLIEYYEINAEQFTQDSTDRLASYIRIINGIGDTFKNVYAEFVLHDVRNPIHSIVAAKNTEYISGRKIGDPSTRFVYQYVTNQGKLLLQAMDDGSKINYYKRFKKDKFVKATTIPISDHKYGLIAILCINIDIDGIKNLDTWQMTEFFENYVKNSGHTPSFEN